MGIFTRCLFMYAPVTTKPKHFGTYPTLCSWLVRQQSAAAYACVQYSLTPAHVITHSPNLSTHTRSCVILFFAQPFITFLTLAYALWAKINDAWYSRRSLTHFVSSHASTNPLLLLRRLPRKVLPKLAVGCSNS